MRTIWDYINNNKMITVFNIAVLLLFILPDSITYAGGDNETDPLIWTTNYTYENLELFLYFIPIFLLTIGFQIMKYKKWKNLLLSLLGLQIVQCCFLSLIAFLTLTVPIQDYLPSWGQLIMITLGPLTLIIWSIEYKTITDNEQ